MREVGGGGGGVSTFGGPSEAAIKLGKGWARMWGVESLESRG